MPKDPGTGIFVWILQNFSEHLFLQNLSGRLLLEVTLCVDHVLKFFLFVYNYNSEDGRVEMEKKLTEKNSTVKIKKYQPILQ